MPGQRHSMKAIDCVDIGALWRNGIVIRAKGTNGAIGALFQGDRTRATAPMVPLVRSKKKRAK